MRASRKDRRRMAWSGCALVWVAAGVAGCGWTARDEFAASRGLVFAPGDAAGADRPVEARVDAADTAWVVP